MNEVTLPVEYYEITKILGEEKIEFNGTHLKNSFRKGKFQIFRGEDGEIIGYFIWANVIKEAIWVLKNNGNLPIYPHEWDEGNITLLLHVYFRDEKKLKNSVLLLNKIREFRAVSYVRRDKFSIKIRNKGIFRCKKYLLSC